MTAVAAEPGRRERARAATIAEIKAVARKQMAEQGTAALTLRAVAREMGMTPSALYRYFASRDDILTALIAESYDEVGQRVEEAVSRAPKDDPASGFLTAAAAFRSWAVQKPSDFALLYGSPIPGYEAPADPARAAGMRTPAALLATMVAGLELGQIRLPMTDADLPPVLRDDFGVWAADKGLEGYGATAAAMAMMAWHSLCGFLACEVFRHLPEHVMGDQEVFFELAMRRVLLDLGTDPECVRNARVLGRAGQTRPARSR